jgi:hypothetical protein
MGGLRTPFLVGVVIGVVSIAVGAVGLTAESDDGNGTSALLGVPVMVVLAFAAGVGSGFPRA